MTEHPLPLPPMVASMETMSQTIAPMSIARMGNPILHQRAKPIDVSDQRALDNIRHLVDQMTYTLEALGGRIGLAAPQVHIPLQLVIFRIPSSPPNPRYALQKASKNTPLGETIPLEEIWEEVPSTIMINPEITHFGDRQALGFEGCISVPGLLGEVPRYHFIQYTFYDLDGNKQSRTARGFHARVVQHECDHLEGILFPMRIVDQRRFGFEEEILEYESLNTRA